MTLLLLVQDFPISPSEPAVVGCWLLCALGGFIATAILAMLADEGNWFAGVLAFSDWHRRTLDAL